MKTYIIRLSENSLSCELAKDAYNAAVQFNYDPVYFQAIDGHDCDYYFKINDIKLVENEKNIEWTIGTKGCFVSHWTLWNMCAEQHEPFVILEHDGIPVRELPEEIVNEVKDACHLDAFLPFNSQYNDDSEEYFDIYDKKVKFYKKEGMHQYPSNNFYGSTNGTGSSFRGAYGYILTPQGAKKLIDFVYQYGAYPADRTICEKAVFLQRTNCSYIRYHPFFRSITTQRNFTTRT